MLTRPKRNGRRASARSGIGLACTLVVGWLALPAHAQEPPPPPPPPPLPAQVMPAIVVPTPQPLPPVGMVLPAGRCLIFEPAPSTSPFWPTFPPPAGTPLDLTPPLLVDFWAIGRHDVSSSSSQFALGKLSIAYDFRYPVGQLTVGARPQFDVMFLDGPTPPGPDLPPQVYGLSVALEAEYRFSPQASIRLGLTPGLYTDFTNLSSQAFRVPVQLVGAYAIDPQLTLVGGVMYTAQPSWSFLPVVGAIWTPTEDWRFEFTFPRTRVIYRLPDGLDIYGVLAMNGDTYAVRSGVIDDLMQYRDWRLGVGAEWSTPVRLRLFFEAGAAFSRR